MKLLLISAPTVMSYKAKITSTQYPVNLGIISSYLKVRGHDVRLIDFNVDAFSKKRLHASIEEYMPDAVGISAMTPSIKNAHLIAEAIKERFEDIPIIIGGPHASAIPEQTLKEFPSFDIAVVGEGEETTYEIMEYLKNNKKLEGILGTAWRKNSKIVVEKRRPLIEDINSLPFPDRTLVDMKKYENSHASRGFSRKFLNIAEVFASRGCPNQCIFCATHINYGMKVRFRTIDNLMAEIRYCKERLGVNHVSVEDDTFTLKRPLVEQFCKEIKKLGLTWNCNARVTNVDPKLLKLMKDSGCLKISFGVETGSPRIMKLIKKNITIEQVKKAFRWARESGIRYVEGTFMVGAHPDETKDDIDKTLKLMKEISPDFLAVSVIDPYPGTEVYEIMKSNNYIHRFDWERFINYGQLPTWRTKYFSGKGLVKQQKRLLIGFYFRPSTVLRILKKIRSWNEFMYWVDIGLGFVKS